MRLDEKWLKVADEALTKNGIVMEEVYDKAYKGYFSSFGASIVQSGLLAASMFFERKSSGAESDRTLIVDAVVEVLKNMGCLDGSEIKSLASYVSGVKSEREKARLLYNTDKAIASLKLVLRQYGQKEKIVADSNEESDIVRLSLSNGGNSRVMSSHNYTCGSNMGWLYYRNYYKGLTDEGVVDFELYFMEQNERITHLCFNNFENNKELIRTLSPKNLLCFQTVYPGLLIGSGLSHGTGLKNDMKIGFVFDYTTGLPYIPGSSVKGVLRSMFPSDKPEEKIEDDKLKYEYIEEKLKKKEIQIKATKEDIWKLKCFLFDEYQNAVEGASRNTYFDALIVRTDNFTKTYDDKYKGKGIIMGDDYITPHKKPTKNPIPLQFLKVLPRVTFCFPFKLSKYFIGGKEVNLGELFKLILQDTGIGAKTNVGYGNLRFIGYKLP